MQLQKRTTMPRHIPPHNFVSLTNSFDDEEVSMGPKFGVMPLSISTKQSKHALNVDLGEEYQPDKHKQKKRADSAVRLTKTTSTLKKYQAPIKQKQSQVKRQKSYKPVARNTSARDEPRLTINTLSTNNLDHHVSRLPHNQVYKHSIEVKQKLFAKGSKVL